jgi:hypothetical protein
MPTDLAGVLARKRAVRAEMQNDISLLLMCTIIALAQLMLLFGSPTFAEAVALIGSY